MAVLVHHRSKNAHKVQEALTNHGCVIKMRLGLHETGEYCSEDGLIMLQLCGDKAEIEDLKNTLNSFEGVKAEFMTLEN